MDFANILDGLSQEEIDEIARSEQALVEKQQKEREEMMMERKAKDREARIAKGLPPDTPPRSPPPASTTVDELPPLPLPEGKHQVQQQQQQQQSKPKKEYVSKTPLGPSPPPAIIPAKEWESIRGTDLIIKKNFARDKSKNQTPQDGDLVTVSIQGRLLSYSSNATKQDKKLSEATYATPSGEHIANPLLYKYSHFREEDVCYYFVNAHRIVTTVGDGELPLAANLALKEIFLNESGVVRSSSKYSYGKGGNRAPRRKEGIRRNRNNYDYEYFLDFNLYSEEADARLTDVPPSTPVEYVITVHNIVPKASFTIDTDITKMMSKKFFGNEKFRLNEMDAALNFYSAGSFLAQYHIEQAVNSPKYGAKLRDAFVDLNNNIATAHFRQSSWAESKKAAKKVLRMDSDNVKATIRLIQCQIETGDFDEAHENLKHIVVHAPDSDLVKAACGELKRRKAKYKNRKKQLYKKMLGGGGSGSGEKKKDEDDINDNDGADCEIEKMIDELADQDTREKNEHVPNNPNSDENDDGGSKTAEEKKNEEPKVQDIPSAKGEEAKSLRKVSSRFFFFFFLLLLLFFFFGSCCIHQPDIGN